MSKYFLFLYSDTNHTKIYKISWIIKTFLKHHGDPHFFLLFICVVNLKVRYYVNSDSTNDKSNAGNRAFKRVKESKKL